LLKKLFSYHEPESLFCQAESRCRRLNVFQKAATTEFHCSGSPIIIYNIAWESADFKFFITENPLFSFSSPILLKKGSVIRALCLNNSGRANKGYLYSLILEGFLMDRNCASD